MSATLNVDGALINGQKTEPFSGEGGIVPHIRELSHGSISRGSFGGKKIVTYFKWVKYNFVDINITCLRSSK